MNARTIEVCEKNRFTKFVPINDIQGLRDLESWVEHFRTSGIHAQIGRTRDGYAVYREGLVNSEFHDED